MKNVFEEMAQTRSAQNILIEKNLHKARENKEFAKILDEIKGMEFRGQLGEEYEQKVLEMSKILNKMGMSINDLLPKYECDRCHDTGVKDGRVCQCVKDRVRKGIEESIGGRLDKSHTFHNANLDLFDDRQKIENLYNKIQSWVEGLETSQFKNLILVGSTGVGKTYLAECIANSLVERNVEIRYLSAFAFGNMLLQAHTTFDEKKWEIIDDLVSVPVLIIDDLGSEPKYKNVTEEYMTAILGERMKEGLTNIYTTNLTLDGLMERYSERVFSRLINKANTLTVKIDNSDLRLKRK